MGGEREGGREMGERDGERDGGEREVERNRETGGERQRQVQTGRDSGR